MQIDTDIFMKSFEDAEIAERSYGDILSGYMCRCYTCGLGYYGPKRSCTCKKCMRVRGFKGDVSITLQAW